MKSQIRDAHHHAKTPSKRRRKGPGWPEQHACRMEASGVDWWEPAVDSAAVSMFPGLADLDLESTVR
eukprot:4287282-Lingulodinium_polyedra.AAC.1